MYVENTIHFFGGVRDTSPGTMACQNFHYFPKTIINFTMSADDLNVQNLSQLKGILRKSRLTSI